MDRRSFLSTSLFAFGASMLPGAAQASAQPAAPPSKPPQPPQPTRMERVTEAVAAVRMPIDFDGTRFSGAGYDFLVRRGSESHAFLLGEEHGIAENPKLAGQLVTALAPTGYTNVAIEISPPLATAIDRALDRGSAAATAFLTAPETRVAFYGMKEEAEFLGKAHAALGRRKPALWGLDYEVAADRYLIQQLQNARKPPAASAAVARLGAASAASWADYERTHDPKFIYGFAGDPDLVRAVSAAWPRPDASSRMVLDTLEQTFAINRLWFEKNGYGSNLLRSQLMRTNLLRYWKQRSPGDRLFMKFGASHMVRGVSMTDIFDLGTIVPELLAQQGGKAFHLLVLPGPGTQTANLDPSQFRYVPGNRDQYGEGMDVFDNAVIPGKFTLFDTAPLRPIASSYRDPLPLPLWRVIHGFDAVLIMTGSHPSANL